MVAIITIPGTREDMENFTPFPEEIANVGTPKRREQDIRMMQSKQHWPNAMLAMKRLDRASGHLQLAVWDGTSLYIDAVWFGGEMIEQPSAVLQETPEVIVAQGWSVD